MNTKTFQERLDRLNNEAIRDIASAIDERFNYDFRVPYIESVFCGNNSNAMLTDEQFEQVAFVVDGLMAQGEIHTNIGKASANTQKVHNFVGWDETTGTRIYSSTNFRYLKDFEKETN